MAENCDFIAFSEFSDYSNIKCSISSGKIKIVFTQMDERKIEYIVTLHATSEQSYEFNGSYISRYIDTNEECVSGTASCKKFEDDEEYCLVGYWVEGDCKYGWTLLVQK